MGIGDDLKNILREHLEKTSCSIFLDKSLTILNESADSKESLMAASDRISKRIALFIDEELAGRVLEHLKAEMRKSASPPGKKGDMHVFPLPEKYW